LSGIFRQSGGAAAPPAKAGDDMDHDAEHPLFRPATWRRSLGSAVLGLIYFIPVIWMLLAAIKTRQDALATPPKLIFTPTFEHFRSLFTGFTADGQQVFPTGFQYYIMNSVVIAGTSVLLALILGMLAAYGFARMPVPGTHWLMFYMLALRMIPPLTTIIPLYVVFSRIGMGGTYPEIILVYTAFNLPFAVWMLRSFLLELPRAAEEAAWLDGSSRLTILWRICLPQMRAGLAATAIIAFVFTWNDFLFSQILTGQDTRTIPIAMLRVLGADFGADWGLFAAAGAIYLAPVLLVAFFLQNQLLRGATFGTVTR
jgi:multiple sugar transport system permease protein